MIDIVDRLKFDATRCELQFSKGVAGNISEAAAVIARLREDRECYVRWAEEIRVNIEGFKTEIERQRAALKPFAEAVDKAATSGRPCFEFVGAADYEAAANALKDEQANDKRS